SPLARAPAPLTHDELKTLRRDLTDYNRLQKTELPDGVHQLGERLFVEDLPRLLRIRLDLLEGDLAVLSTDPLPGGFGTGALARVTPSVTLRGGAAPVLTESGAAA